MRTAALLLIACAAVFSGQEEDKAPPRLKRGQPKATDARGERPPEQKPIPEANPTPANAPPAEAAVRVVVTDADGAVVSEAGLPAASKRSVTAADDTIARARQVSEEFQEKVPNFLCDQITFRHEGEGWPKPTWKLKDRVTAELMHIDGAESYRNMKVSGKILGKGKSPLESGQWSSGDWVTIARDVIHPGTDANFKFDKEDTIGGRPARRYRYSVKQQNSHWRVEPSGHLIKPAYRGAIWIDNQTFRVLRVEMEARELPSDFPFNVVEMTTELGVVRISGEDYLLPVKAENLSCQRDTVTCHRNELEFRNYRRFTAESTISATDSSVKYEGAEDENKAAGAAAPPAVTTNEKKKKKK